MIQIPESESESIPESVHFLRESESSKGSSINSYGFFYLHNVQIEADLMQNTINFKRPKSNWVGIRIAIIVFHWLPFHLYLTFIFPIFTDDTGDWCSINID